MALSKKHQDAAAAAELEKRKAEKQERLGKIKSQLTADQMATYRQHFELFDLNGDGVINARELRKVSRQMGYRLDDSQIEVHTLYKQRVLPQTADSSFAETNEKRPELSNLRIHWRTQRSHSLCLVSIIKTPG